MNICGYERAYSLLELIWETWDGDTKDWYIKANTIELHSSLGRILRDGASLWDDEWQPLLIENADGALHDHSHQHPDAISARVMKTFQENKKREQQ